jgi:hypothetical protein
VNSYLEPLDRAQEHMRRHYPVWDQDLGSEADATASFQHLLRRGGHPEADDAEAFKHPTPGWNQSQLGRGDVGQLTAAIHPHRWNYGTLAHETAHALHQLHTGEKPASVEHAHDDDFMEHYRHVGNMITPGAGDALHEAYHQERHGSRLGFRQAGKGPLYHGTSRDLTSVEPADRHGQGEMSTGLTRTDRAYATHDPQMARSYAEMSGIDTGGRPRVYQVEHSGPAHDLEPDPGYDADVRTPHSFRVLREVPEHELNRLPRHAAQEERRCPCGLPVEYDPQDGWQHADGSIGHDDEFYGKSVSDLMEEQHGRTAGKGKPRRDAPDVARGADQAGQGPARRVAPDSGRDGDGGEPPAPLRALAEHPKVSRDLAKLSKNVKAAYHERVDGLRRGEPHSSTHALTGPLKGWQATSLNFQNRVVHRYDGDELHVLSAGNHDESYDQGARRLGRYTAPHARLFGPTFGLDTRLFDGEHLRPQVRVDVITRFDTFCHEHGYEGWHRWAKVVFFGSQASAWTSKTLVGNGDFDLSIGLHYQALRATVPGFEVGSDAEIADMFTQQMHAELNDPEHAFPGVPGTFDLTWFCNLKGWDIARIKPYAAYDLVEGAWIVKPPELPDWSMADFPEGPGMEEAVRGIIELAEGYLKMPEPYRTQNGAALWEFVHSNRSDAFGPNGEGWWDSRNVVEKALDQKGLMQQLFDCRRRAAEDPASLAAPTGWSNSPVAAR